MKRFPSIKKNSDFQTIYRTAKSYANRQLVMYVRKTENTQSRIGISVSKKVGNSVVRHHLARLVRESFRLNRDTLEEGLDIIVVARAAAKDSDYKTIELPFVHGTAISRVNTMNFIMMYLCSLVGCVLGAIPGLSGGLGRTPDR